MANMSPARFCKAVGVAPQIIFFNFPIRSGFPIVYFRSPHPFLLMGKDEGKSIMNLFEHSFDPHGSFHQSRLSILTAEKNI